MFLSHKSAVYKIKILHKKKIFDLFEYQSYKVNFIYVEDHHTSIS